MGSFPKINFYLSLVTLDNLKIMSNLVNPEDSDPMAQTNHESIALAITITVLPQENGRYVRISHGKLFNPKSKIQNPKYSDSQASEVQANDALCPMPYALCPMPYALCPSVPH